MTIKKTRYKSLELTPENIKGLGGTDFTRNGEIGTDSSDNELKVRLNGDTKTVVTEDQIQVLTNKGIDADTNTILNLETDNLKSGVLNTSTTLASASNTQVPSALAVKTYVDNKAAAQNEASEISFNPTTSGLSATNVQDAIDQVEARLDTAEGSISTNASNISNHINDTTDAHAASAISNTPSGNLSATTVQAALNELQSDINAISGGAATVQTNLDNHINDTSDAHDASAISNVPSGNLAATDVQTALNELQSDIDTRATATALNDHINDSSDAHDASAISNIPSGNLAATDVQGALNELQSDVDLRALTTNGSIITPVRLDFKQGTKASLITYATTATNGQAVYATDTKEYLAVKDGLLSPLGGGSAGLSSIFQLTASEAIGGWSTGNNAAFLGGGTLAGTFAKETVSPLKGDESYKYTQAAGSLNDYIASPAQTVDRRFRGTQAYLSIPYQYDGLSSDILVVIYDVTNSTVISTSSDFIVANNGSNNTAIVGVNIPNTCASIRVGFQVKAVNSGKILSFDDIELSASLFQSVKTADYQAIIFSNQSRSSQNLINIDSNTNNGIISLNTSTGVMTVLKPCLIHANTTVLVATLTQRAVAQIYINGSIVATDVNDTANNNTNCSASISRYLNTGDTLYLYVGGSADNAIGSVIAEAQSSAVAIPNQQISSDTIPFTFKSTAIDPNTDAIGTFNTYTYAANTNTATIATSAPTQSVTSMNTNGVQVFGRAFNAASTSASPARVDIFIGKGLKSKEVVVYASLAKINSIAYNIQPDATGTTIYGSNVIYDESSGILRLDAGYTSNGATNTNRLVAIDTVTNSGASNAYFVFNASKSASITAIPELAPRIAYLSDVKASGTGGGTFTSGAWQTRTLNTLIDPTGIVTSLSSNVFTLPSGTYLIEASAPADLTNGHMAKLFNNTLTTDVLFGTSAHAPSTLNTTSRSIIVGEITITNPTSFTIQHRCVTTSVTEGFGKGANIGSSEKYTEVKITKIK